MVDKAKLKDVLTDLVGDNNEQAQVDFHQYLADKMKEFVGGEAAVSQESEPQD